MSGWQRATDEQDAGNERLAAGDRQQPSWQQATDGRSPLPYSRISSKKPTR